MFGVKDGVIFPKRDKTRWCTFSSDLRSWNPQKLFGVIGSVMITLWGSVIQEVRTVFTAHFRLWEKLLWGQNRYHKETVRQRFCRTFGWTFWCDLPQNPCFTGERPSGSPLELFRKSFGAIHAISWLCESFSAPDLSGGGVARNSAARRQKKESNRNKVESQTIDSESPSELHPIRIASYQCLKAILESHDSNPTILNRPILDSESPILGGVQRPLILILLQKYRNTNGRRIAIQSGGV